MYQIVKNIATLYCNIQTCQRCGLSPSNSSLVLLIKFLLMLYYVYSLQGVNLGAQFGWPNPFTSIRSTLDMPLHYNFFYSKVLNFCCCKMFYQNYVETLPEILVSIKGQLFKESKISFVITQKCIFGNSFCFCVLSYISWYLVFFLFNT